MGTGGKVDPKKLETETSRKVDEFIKKQKHEANIPNMKSYYTEDDRKVFKKKNIVVFRPDNNKQTKKLIKKTEIRRKDYNSALFAAVYKSVITSCGADLMSLEFKEDS